MKKLLPIFLVMLLAISCGDECKDEFCPTGYVCVDGVCEKSDGTCPIGFEGDDCATASNAKFAGNYSTDYTGTGGLTGSDGSTLARVSTVANKPDKIYIQVELQVSANVLGQAIDVPLDVEIEASVEGDTYYIPNTTINTEVAGLPISLNFEVEGEKISENQLNSTLTMTGALSGTIEMEGIK